MGLSTKLVLYRKATKSMMFECVLVCDVVGPKNMQLIWKVCENICPEFTPIMSGGDISSRCRLINPNSNLTNSQTIWLTNIIPSIINSWNLEGIPHNLI